MKVAIIYNKDFSGVINKLGIQNKEIYSTETVQKVANALESGGHNVRIIDGNMHVIERLQSFMPSVMEGEKVGIVFNMAYGIQGESRYTHIPSMLEMLGVPYVGSTPSGHALALDKVLTKVIIQKHGIPTPDFWVFSDPKDDISSVKYPVIVKPKMESVSYGLKIVYTGEQLREAIHFVVTEFQQQALVEQFIRGREFCVGLLGNSPVESFPILEIDLENDPDGIQTADHKKAKPRKKICPADLSQDLATQMTELSVGAFNALHLRDFSRVDIRMDENNQIYILEINSMASLGTTGSYMAAAQVAGYDYSSLVNKMLDVASVRYFPTPIPASSEYPKKGKKIPLHIKLRGFLRSRQDNIESLLKRMVNTNSYVRNAAGVNELGNLIRRELGSLGFTQEVFPQMEVGNQLFFTNSFDDDMDVIIIGNLDNDRKISGHEYYRVEEQKLHGTGIWEHKGGIAIAIAALQGLKFSRYLRKIKIGLLFTTDDSLQGKFSRLLLEEKTRKAGVVLGLHGSNMSGSIVTSRSGSAVYHFSQKLIGDMNSEEVPVATSVFSRLIGSWSELSIDDKELVISPAKTFFKSNIMQPYAYGESTISVRFNHLDDFEQAEARIKKTIPRKKYRDSLHFQLEGGLRRPPLVETPQIIDLWQFTKDIGDRLDINLTKEHRWSSSDICFVERGKQVADGLGPAGVKPQDGSEYILRYSLLERALLLAMMISELPEFKKK